MALNKILQFAGDVDNANVLTQAEYEVDPQRTLGNQPGVARSKLVNKAMRQASVMAAGVAQFLADNQEYDIDDELTPAQVSNAFALAFINGLASLITTRPQFDDTENTATTEFVQRALGNHSDSEQLNSPVIMDASHAGKFIALNNAGATLPDPATVPKGTKITIKSVGSVYVQIYCVIGQMLFYGLSTSASVSLYPGDTLELVSDGGSNWYASGSGATRYMSNWSASLAGNGYQKLPSGLIVQWGFVSGVAAGASVSITYPTAFPNAFLSASSFAESASSAVVTSFHLTGRPTTSGMTARNSNTTGPISLNWIALGY